MYLSLDFRKGGNYRIFEMKRSMQLLLGRGEVTEAPKNERRCCMRKKFTSFIFLTAIIVAISVGLVGMAFASVEPSSGVDSKVIVEGKITQTALSLADQVATKQGEANFLSGQTGSTIISLQQVIWADKGAIENVQPCSMNIIEPLKALGKDATQAEAKKATQSITAESVTRLYIVKNDNSTVWNSSSEDLSQLAAVMDAGGMGGGALQSQNGGGPAEGSAQIGITQTAMQKDYCLQTSEPGI
jgi:hypothetical protein